MIEWIELIRAANQILIFIVLMVVVGIPILLWVLVEVSRAVKRVRGWF